MEFGKIRNYIFLSLLFGATALFLIIVRPFSYTIFWAAVLAALFHPMYRRIDRFIKNKSLSAVLSIVSITLIILIPLFIISTLLLNEVTGLYDAIRNNRGDFANTLQSINYLLHNNTLLPRLGIDDAMVTTRINEFSQYLIDFVFRSAQTITQSSVEFAALFIIMLYTLFYFLLDGEKLLHKMMYLLPLGDKYELKLYRKFTAAASATIRGTILIGLLQGALGGVLFAIVGIPGAIIWGIVMAALSIIPVTGSFLVWMPAGIILLSTGKIWQGLTVILVGTFFISVIDNILRPIIVGKDLRIHPLIILFSTLGGLVVFGVSGFMIGPIVAALFLSFWEMYEEYYRDELRNN